MIKKLINFFKKKWFDILIWWILLCFIMGFYASTDIKFNLLNIPIFSFFIVIIFHLELDKKNFGKWIYFIELLLGICLGLLVQVGRSKFCLLNGIIWGGLVGITAPLWIKLLLFLKEKIGDYV